MKRFLEKTGIKEEKSFFNFKIAGLIGVVVSMFVSCNKNGIKNKENKPSDNNRVTLTTTTLYSIEKSTSNIQPLIDEKPVKNCGPVPGYPCGTKYYTVSINDFLA